jgi:hypothetical protein
LRGPGTLILLTGYAAGFAIIGWVLLGSSKTVNATISPAEIALPTFETPPPMNDSLATFSQIIERPLFQAGRRAASSTPTIDTVPVDVIATDTDSRLDGFRLTAVFSGSGSRTALVELPNGDSLTVSEGDRLESWQILEIGDDQLVLQSRGQRRTLDVHDFAYLGKPRVVPRTRALTERAKRANRRQARTAGTTPPVPRQRRRDEEREDND